MGRATQATLAAIVFAALFATASCSAPQNPSHAESAAAAAAAPAPAEQPIKLLPNGDVDWESVNMQGFTIEVDAPTLFKAYQDNEITADKLYKGTSLIVSGTVLAIESDIANSPVVSLQAGDLGVVYANGLPVNAAGNLARGQSVKLECIGAGEVGGLPILANCRKQ